MFKLKQILIAVLLLCLWQNARSGNVTLVNVLKDNGEVKYKIVDAYGKELVCPPIPHEHAITIRLPEGFTIIGTSSKATIRWGGRHYTEFSEVKKNSKEDFIVAIYELNAYRSSDYKAILKKDPLPTEVETILKSEPVVVDVKGTDGKFDPVVEDAKGTVDKVEPVVVDAKETVDKTVPVVVDVKGTVDKTVPVEDAKGTVDKLEPVVVDAKETVDKTVPVVVDVKGTVDKVEPVKLSFPSVGSTSSVIKGEPRAFYQGQKSVFHAYSEFSERALDRSCISQDVCVRMPVYIASFREKASFGFKHSRVSLDKYIPGAEPVPMICSVEFSPSSSLDKLPKGIQAAIAAKYPKIDMSSGLYKGLLPFVKDEDIFVTASAFGPIPPSTSTLVPSFNVNPFGFTAWANQDKSASTDNVYIGLFQNKGVDSWSTNPLAKDSLGDQSFPSNGAFSKDLMGCQLTNPDGGFASCYVVAITKDLRQVLVSHILIAVSPLKFKEIETIFSVKQSYKELLGAFELHTRTYSGTDKQSLEDYLYSSERLSENAGIFLPFENCHTTYKWAPAIKREITTTPPSLSAIGKTTGVLFRLPIIHLKKGDTLSMRGTLRSGKIEFGLTPPDERAWMAIQTIGVGEFDTTITAPFEGDFLPLCLNDKTLNIDVTITDISLP